MTLEQASPLNLVGTEPEAIFHFRIGVVVTLVVLLSGLLGLLIYAALFGPGFEAASSDPVWAVVLIILLCGILLPFFWILWRKPIVMRVGSAGLHLPFAFKRPLRWEDIHRFRLASQGALTYGRRQWLIIDPAPGVLAPIRLKSWQRLDLWFQKHHGVRIPLHGLDSDFDTVIQSIEHYRPVDR